MTNAVRYKAWYFHFHPPSRCRTMSLSCPVGQSVILLRGKVSFISMSANVPDREVPWLKVSCKIAMPVIAIILIYVSSFLGSRTAWTCSFRLTWGLSRNILWEFATLIVPCLYLQCPLCCTFIGMCVFMVMMRRSSWAKELLYRFGFALFSGKETEKEDKRCTTCENVTSRPSEKGWWYLKNTEVEIFTVHGTRKGSKM